MPSRCGTIAVWYETFFYHYPRCQIQNKTLCFAQDLFKLRKTIIDFRLMKGYHEGYLGFDDKVLCRALMKKGYDSLCVG